MVLAERRAAPRVPMVCPIVVHRGTPEAPPARTFAIDLSTAGLLVSGPADLEIGERVWLSLDIGPGAPPVDGEASVVRQTSSGYKGMRFERLAPTDRRRLACLLDRIQAED